MKSFLILGAGRFGASVAKTLVERGHDVMVVDRDEALIQEISEEMTNAVVADVTMESNLKSFGVRDFDVVVLAIGSDIQASIITAILLLELGAAYVVAKAHTDLHGKVLQKIGVHRVVHPERDVGQKIAHSLVAPSIIELIELSDDYSVVEVSAPKSMIGKTLKELDLRARYGISVIALRRHDGDHTNISPVAEDQLAAEDIIVAIGENKAFKKLEWI